MFPDLALLNGSSLFQTHFQLPGKSHTTNDLSRIKNKESIMPNNVKYLNHLRNGGRISIEGNYLLNLEFIVNYCISFLLVMQGLVRSVLPINYCTNQRGVQTAHKTSEDKTGSTQIYHRILVPPVRPHEVCSWCSSRWSHRRHYSEPQCLHPTKKCHRRYPNATCHRRCF